MSSYFTNFKSQKEKEATYFLLKQKKSSIFSSQKGVLKQAKIYKIFCRKKKCR